MMNCTHILDGLVVIELERVEHNVIPLYKVLSIYIIYSELRDLCVL